MKPTPIEDIELDVTNARMWFEYDREKLLGGVETLETQNVLTYTTAEWFREQIKQLDIRFKALEICYYKMKDIAKGGKDE